MGNSGNLSDPRPTVLVVEDHEDSLTAMAEYLAFSRFEVRTARNAIEAMTALMVRDAPQVLLLDILLGPPMGGLELLERIRIVGLGIPTVVYTGHPDMWKRAGARTDVYRSLLKPQMFEDIPDILRAAIAARRRSSARA